ncbi:MAG: DUF4215 domain-containing protein [bacterium]|nr:DUF4215 domain-containing protein [bacterium]
MGTIRSALIVFLSLGLAAGAIAAQEPPTGIDPDILAELDDGRIFARGFTPCEVLVTVADGNGAPGQTGRPVQVRLQTSVPLTQLEFEVHDTPDLLTADGCNSTTSGFTCNASDSGVASVSFSSPSSTVGPGANIPVLELLYAVAPGAPAGAISLSPMQLSATSEQPGACTVASTPGSFVVSFCGDGEINDSEECDDGNTEDGDCCSASCTLEPAGATCEDGLHCTVDDSCDAAGICVAGAARDCDDGIACTDDTCDEAANACSVTPRPAGTTCEDGQYCTVDDACDGAGACASGAARDCSDDIDCTDDVCDEAANACGATPIDAACDNGLVCDGDETCSSVDGCVPGMPLDCDDSVGCTDDVCNEPSGCSQLPDDLLCDNGLVCDGAETCSPVEDCVPGVPLDCDDGVGCTEDVCNEPIGCSQLPDDLSCDNGLFCDGVETCDVVADCRSGTAVICDDDELCTDDICNEVLDRCVFVDDPNNDPSCDPCAPGPGMRVPAVTSGTSPSAGLSADAIAAEELPIGIDPDIVAKLDDGRIFAQGFTPCEVLVTITDGNGVPGQAGRPVQVRLQTSSALTQLEFEIHDIPDLLTADGCNSMISGFTCDATDGGVASVNFSSPSSTVGPGADIPAIELLYTVAPGTPTGTTISLTPMLLSATDDQQEACSVSATPGSFAVSICGDGVVDGSEECDDGNIESGDCCSACCTLEPAGATCEDGLYCTVGDGCDAAGICVAGAARDCSDGIACTDDMCDEAANVCSATPIDAACDNGLVCDGDESCSPVEDCVSGVPLDCDDGVDCTEDVCNEPSGCSQLPDDLLCDNGLFCDGVETCDAIDDCQSGTAIVCDDDELCTDDTCDEGLDGCVFVEDPSNDPVCDPCTPGPGMRVPAATSGTSLSVEFYDSVGNLLTDLDVSAFTDQASWKLSSDTSSNGTYEFSAQPGDKITFYATDQNRKYNPHTVLLPIDLAPTVQVVLFAPQSQHLCSEAETVNLGDVVPCGDTSGAGSDPNVTGGFCGTSITEGGDALWYDLTLAADTLVSLSTCNDGNPATGSSQYDSKISVFCQDCDSYDFTCVGGNDDGPGCADFSSAFSFCGRGGSTYHILVHGFLGAAGTFELAVIDAGPCTADELCAPILPPPASGACCFDNCDALVAAGATNEALAICAEFDCQELEAEACMTAGGAYQGDDVPCVVLSDTSSSFSSSPAMPIPDNDPVGARDEIIVAGNGGFVGDLDIDIVLTHSWIGDLLAAVTNKDTGTEVVLWNRNCGGSNLLDILSDDEGTQTFCGESGNATTGSIPPALINGFTSFLSDFDGQAIDGAWSLSVDDNFTADTGELTFWSLIFREGASVCPTACDPVTPPGAPGAPGPPGGGDEDSDGDGDSDDAGPEAFLATGRDDAAGAEGLLNLDAATEATDENTEHRARTGRTVGKHSR